MPTTATSDFAAWQVIQSKLAATGWCTRVIIGEPKAPPDPITACIIGDQGFIDETTLKNPREVHQAILRFYAPFLAEPEEAIERDLEQLRANIWADINGEFDLGGNVAYIMPARCSWRWGNLSVSGQGGGVMYRVLDITIAYRIDDRAPFAA